VAPQQLGTTSSETPPKARRLLMTMGAQMNVARFAARMCVRARKAKALSLLLRPPKTVHATRVKVSRLPERAITMKESEILDDEIARLLEPPPEMPPVTCRVLLPYALCAAGEAMFALPFALCFFYYNQVLGLSASYAGAASLLATLANAVGDILIGAAADRYFGQRHLWMRVALLPLALCVVALIIPPAAILDPVLNARDAEAGVLDGDADDADWRPSSRSARTMRSSWRSSPAAWTS